MLWGLMKVSSINYELCFIKKNLQNCENFKILNLAQNCLKFLWRLNFIYPNSNKLKKNVSGVIAKNK